MHRNNGLMYPSLFIEEKGDSMELTVGKVYLVRHSSGMINWKFQEEKKFEGFNYVGTVRRSRTRYYGGNLKTGREVVLKSKDKICKEIN